jgi:hypothetical protein
LVLFQQLHKVCVLLHLGNTDRQLKAKQTLHGGLRTTHRHMDFAAAATQKADRQR